MLADDVKSRLEEGIAALAGRVEHALDLSELLARGAVPNARHSAFVVPAGIRPQGGGEAAAGAFTQSLDEVIAIVLVLNSAGDVTGAKASLRIDELFWQVVPLIGGWAPPDLPDALYVGVFRFLRGQLVSLTKGLAIYQVEFAIELQLRIFE